MEKQKCGGCKAVISDKRFMSCATCSQKYDLQCANLSPKRYRGLNDESKQKWKCHECKSKQPKADNSDTPVRPGPGPSVPLTVDDSVGECLLSGSNVTLRKKASSSSSACNDYITEGKMKEMLKADRQETRLVVESCVNGLSEQIDAVKIQCHGYQESLSFVSKQYDELRKELADMKKQFAATNSELKSIKDENKALKETMHQQSTRIKALEEESSKQQQWSRMQNIEVIGIPEQKEEVTSTVIQNLIHFIGVPIELSDIEFAHRVQPRRSTSSDRTSRAIVVRLRQRVLKDRIVAAARKHRSLNARDLGLGGESNRVFINEHLTKENKMLLSSCKQKAREANYKFVWTKNCRIYVRRNENSPPTPISSPADMVKIV